MCSDGHACMGRNHRAPDLEKKKYISLPVAERLEAALSLGDDQTGNLYIASNIMQH